MTVITGLRRRRSTPRPAGRARRRDRRAGLRQRARRHRAVPADGDAAAGGGTRGRAGDGQNRELAVAESRIEKGCAGTPFCSIPSSAFSIAVRKCLDFSTDSAVALPEDRRKLDARLVVVQYLVIAGFVALALGVLVLPGRPAREVPRDGREQPPAAARRCARRAACIFDRDGKVLVENRDSFVISLVREHSGDLDQTIRLLARVVGVDESVIRDAIRRHRSEPLYRPIPIVEDATLAQVAAVTARRLDTELPGRAGRARADAALPGRRDGGARVRLRERGDRGAAGEGRPATRATSWARPASRRLYNPLLMGAGRRAPRGGQQRGPRNPDARRSAADRRPPRAADDRLRPPARRRGRRSRRWATPARRSCSTRTPAKCWPTRACPATTRTRSRPASTGPRGRRSTPTTLKPLQDRAIQGRYSPGSTFKMAVATAALEEGIITPDFTVHLPRRRRTSTAACSSAGRRTATARVDLRHAIEQSCDVYFYTLGKMVGVDSSTSGRRASASASRAASTCRTRSPASSRRPSGSG